MTPPHPHPYHPPTLELPQYAPPTRSRATLLIMFCGTSGALLAAAWQSMSRMNASLTARAKAAAAWFLFCGLLHVHFEGYFVKHRRALAGRTDVVAELWKEYALSDSRYLAQDDFVVAIEALTVVRSPLPAGESETLMGDSCSSARCVCSRSSPSSETAPGCIPPACSPAAATSTACSCTSSPHLCSTTSTAAPSRCISGATMSAATCRGCSCPPSSGGGRPEPWPGPRRRGSSSKLCDGDCVAGGTELTAAVGCGDSSGDRPFLCSFRAVAVVTVDVHLEWTR